MAVTLQPVLVETGTRDEEGRLVFVDGRLVAVLCSCPTRTRTSPDTGSWSTASAGSTHLTFPGLGAATAWIAEQCRRPTALAEGGRSP